MAKTALELTQKERNSYRTLEIIQKRKQAQKGQIEKRWSQAQSLANQAAKILYEKFGAEQVCLFGSAAQPTWFTLWSDVDLAVWGVKPEQFYAAVAAVTGLNVDIKVDLVNPKDCSSEFQLDIEKYGVRL